jgi:hypothetical protein
MKMFAFNEFTKMYDHVFSHSLEEIRSHIVSTYRGHIEHEAREKLPVCRKKKFFIFKLLTLEACQNLHDFKISIDCHQFQEF